MEHVAGRIPVLECLRAQKRAAHKLYVLAGARGIEDILRAASQISVIECSRQDLDRLLPDTVHQGVVLEAEPLPVLDIGDWLERLEQPNAVAAVLDEIEDPHNFGAIVRSAAACGACGVIFGKHRTAPISPAAMKSAAGAMEYIDMVQAPNLAKGLEQLKKAGFWVAALDADAPQLLWEADLTGRIALVIGNEGKGIRRLINEKCDFHLRIPLSGPITSLNASTSAAIALAECLRQRHAH